jgi:hypothetical protein
MGCFCDVPDHAPSRILRDIISTTNLREILHYFFEIFMSKSGISEEFYFRTEIASILVIPYSTSFPRVKRKTSVGTPLTAIFRRY